MITLAATAAVMSAPAADAQDRVDQRRTTGGAERVQPGQAGRIAPPPATRSPVRAGGPVDQRAPQFAGGQNPIVGDPGAEFRRRNAIVTDNAPGGRGFRGIVGYSSAFDFRDELGSNDLFSFRAGSALSDIRLIQALPGAAYGRALLDLEISRSARGAAMDDLRRSELQGQQLEDFQRWESGLNTRVAELRRVVDATALDFGLDRYVELSGAATAVGRTTTATGAIRRLDASPLAGLQPGLADPDLNQFGVRTTTFGMMGESQNPYLVSGSLSAMDQARLIEDAREGRSTGVVGEAFSDAYVDNRVDPAARGDRSPDGRVDASAPSNRVGDVVEDAAADIPAWQQIREEIARRYASAGRGDAVIDGRPTEGEFRELEQDLDRLRRGLGATPGTSAPPPDTPETPATGVGSGRFDGPAAADDEDDAPLDFDRIGRSLRHGQRIDSLVDPEDRSRAGELVGRGESELRRGEYFRAERDFTRALRLVPGHPTATVGLAHARLGAGLFIPAAIVIRDLFTFQPEMIGALYAEGLVPNRPRLLQALDNLRERVVDRRDSADTGLLIAYLGRLLDRPEVIREGLDLMVDADANDSLPRLLSAVWIEGTLGEGRGAGGAGAAGGAGGG
jgi:hypothetical protein